MTHPDLLIDAEALIGFVHQVAGGDFAVEVDVSPFIQQRDWTEAHFLHVVKLIEDKGWGGPVETSPPNLEGIDPSGERVEAADANADEPLRHHRNFALSQRGAAHIDAKTP